MPKRQKAIQENHSGQYHEQESERAIFVTFRSVVICFTNPTRVHQHEEGGVDPVQCSLLRTMNEILKYLLLKKIISTVATQNKSPILTSTFFTMVSSTLSNYHNTN